MSRKALNNEPFFKTSFRKPSLLTWVLNAHYLAFFYVDTPDVLEWVINGFLPNPAEEEINSFESGVFKQINM